MIEPTLVDVSVRPVPVTVPAAGRWRAVPAAGRWWAIPAGRWTAGRRAVVPPLLTTVRWARGALTGRSPVVAVLRRRTVESLIRAVVLVLRGRSIVRLRTPRRVVRWRTTGSLVRRSGGPLLRRRTGRPLLRWWTAGAAVRTTGPPGAIRRVARARWVCICRHRRDRKSRHGDTCGNGGRAGQVFQTHVSLPFVCHDARQPAWVFSAASLP
jgi:hypothetical protein